MDVGSSGIESFRIVGWWLGPRYSATPPGLGLALLAIATSSSSRDTGELFELDKYTGCKTLSWAHSF